MVLLPTMKASEVKRKTMTSLAYGPYPITSFIPWKKDKGSDWRRPASGGANRTTQMSCNYKHLLIP